MNKFPWPHHDLITDRKPHFRRCVGCMQPRAVVRLSRSFERNIYTCSVPMRRRSTDFRPSTLPPTLDFLGKQTAFPQLYTLAPPRTQSGTIVDHSVPLFCCMRSSLQKPRTGGELSAWSKRTFLTRSTTVMIPVSNQTLHLGAFRAGKSPTTEHPHSIAHGGAFDSESSSV